MAAAVDLVLTGVAVRTMDPIRPVAAAVAIRGDRILAVGSEREVREAAGPRADVVGLPGRLIVPGFQDAHVHPPHSGLQRLRCDLNGSEDRRRYREQIAEYARTHPDEPWILGGGWSMAAFPGGTPRRQDLDEVVSDRPAYLENRDGHGAWVNTRALELAGLTASTLDPEDGRIERDPATGEPSGTLHEGAMELVEDIVPGPSSGQWEAAILKAQAYLHSLGITSWQDAYVQREQLAAYRVLAEGGELTARVVTALWWDRHRGKEQIEELVDLREWGTLGTLRASTVKVMQDGVAENFTAGMLEPYLDAGGRPTGNRGLSFVDPEELKGVVTRLDREGFQVHVHTIGDRAVREALDAIEASVRANGRRDARHHLAHLQVIHPDDLPRFAVLGVTATVQTFWACHEPQMDDLTIPFLGGERSARQYPFASLLRSGAPLACGSDWSVSTPHPLLQMEVAVTRVDPAHRGADPFLPEERITLEQAMEAFTMGSARVNHQERETGSIESGKLADLAVVDRDVFAPDAGPIGDARVLLTMVGGRVVHDTLS
jgi:predicted amidohydrolase YtcJ